MTACKNVKRYTGLKAPKCNGGFGCEMCWRIYSARDAYTYQAVRQAEAATATLVRQPRKQRVRTPLVNAYRGTGAIIVQVKEFEIAEYLRRK